jgi:hypothetical protein
MFETGVDEMSWDDTVGNSHDFLLSGSLNENVNVWWLPFFFDRKIIVWAAATNGHP